jgi:acyl carrier protein
MDEYSLWVLGWFEERHGISAGTPAERLQLDYFQSGLLDSFETMELVAEIESRFEIRFSAEQFQDRRFTTLGGLAQMIAEACAGRLANAA